MRWQCAGGGRLLSASVSDDHRFVSRDFQGLVTVPTLAALPTWARVKAYERVTVSHCNDSTEDEKLKRKYRETDIRLRIVILMRAV